MPSAKFNIDANTMHHRSERAYGYAAGFYGTPVKIKFTACPSGMTGPRGATSIEQCRLVHLNCGAHSHLSLGTSKVKLFDAFEVGRSISYICKFIGIVTSNNTTGVYGQL